MKPNSNKLAGGGVALSVIAFVACDASKEKPAPTTAPSDSKTSKPAAKPRAAADSSADPSAKAEASAVTTTIIYRVLDDDKEIGLITIPPGEVGTLALAEKGGEADRLEMLWADVQKNKEARAKMHRGGKDGERGGLSLVVYPVGKPGYAKGVYNMLMSRYFEVVEVKPE